MRHTAACAVALLLLGGCAAQPVHYTVVAPASAQAVSLLGDTLWSLPLDPKDGPELVARLKEARVEAARDTNKLLGQLHLAQRTADMGRFKEAIAILTRASTLHLGDARLFRLRGEYFLRVREFDLAVADLRQAGMAAMPTMAETVDLPGGSKTITTVSFQTIFLLGTAFYCRGDFGPARIAFSEAVKQATTADDLARAVLWLFFSSRRAGPPGEAAELLRTISGTWSMAGSRDEHDLLLAFKGEMPSDSVRARALNDKGGDERALYSYAIGYLMLIREQPEQARLWFEQARMIPNWAALTYLAAEAELARLGKK
jgi:tetratricopeptide (TPR) repeat protein